MFLQILVLKLNLEEDRDKRRALKTVATLSGLVVKKFVIKLYDKINNLTVFLLEHYSSEYHSLTKKYLFPSFEVFENKV